MPNTLSPTTKPWTAPTLSGGKFQNQSDLDAYNLAAYNSNGGVNTSGGISGAKYDLVGMDNAKRATEWGKANGVWQPAPDSGGFGWGLKDAFLNPAVLAAAGGYGLSQLAAPSAMTAGGSASNVAMGGPTAANAGIDYGAANAALTGGGGINYAAANAALTGAPSAASSGFLGTLGEVGNALKPYSGIIGGGLGLAGTLYATNQATKVAKDAQNSANNAANRLHTTGDSFNNPATGEVSIDPSIRALREQSLQNLPGYRSELNASNSLLQRNLGETRDRFASNENPFIQARVNPLLAQAAQGRGQLSRGMSSRGLGGSSLFANSLGNYDTQTGRGIADQGALATNDQLTALTGLDTQRYQAALSHIQGLQGLDQQQQSIAAQNLAQELSALGLSQADTAGILQAAGLSIQAGQLQNSAYGRAFDSVGRMLNPSAYQPNINIQS